MTSTCVLYVAPGISPVNVYVPSSFTSFTVAIDTPNDRPLCPG